MSEVNEILKQLKAHCPGEAFHAGNKTHAELIANRFMDFTATLIGEIETITEERNRLREMLFSIGKYATGEDQLDAFDDTQALLELAKLVGAYDDPPRYSPDALKATK